VKNYSLVAALPEPLHISWHVLSWTKSKQAYKHVLQSTKRMMTGVEL
jgi:ABC-type nitrate/sulfonate/bicarbonate transport system permease component